MVECQRVELKGFVVLRRLVEIKNERNGMGDKQQVFYAYPSQPQHIGETIEEAIAALAQTDLVDIRSWRSLSITGKLIIDEILQAIDQAAVFACDLTSLNFNVLFELGFAIGRSKRIWISLNNTIEQATHDYARLGATLVPIGYAPYSNQPTLLHALYKDQPWADSYKTNLQLASARTVTPVTKPTLLYLKSKIETDASIRISERLRASPPFDDIILDDPTEMPSETLSWYVESAWRADAVVAHLLSNSHKGATWHNAKCSLVCGLAHGFSKPILMLAHEPFDCPIDYRTMLRTHGSAAQARLLVDSWLTNVRESITAHWRRVGEHQVTQQGTVALRQLSVGEVVAENEEERIDDYFIDTNAYLEALRGQQAIFVGRKGTGKSANLYAVSTALGEDKRNHICIIKPVGYEIQGVLRMLMQSIPKSEKGYLIESLWKFLIYSELALSIVDELATRPMRSDDEQRLVEFVDTHAALLKPPFSIRLEAAVELLCDLDRYRPGDEQRAKVSEVLHDRILRDLRILLGNVLCEKNRVAILVDNLDKAWGSKEDVAYLVELLFGLLNVSGRIATDFQASNHWRKKVNLSLAIFLRSDIFSHVQELAREKDKLSFGRIAWDDAQLLIRVLDKRLTSSLNNALTPDEIWEQFFTPMVEERPVKQFIIENTIPRPRDVIYLVKTAIAEAVNRGHTRVESEDFVSARRKYSQFVFDGVVAEDNPQDGKLEAILYEFAGSPKIVTREEVEHNIEQAGVTGDTVARYLDLLCDLNFLGFETVDGDYEFPQDEAQRKVKQVVARKIAGRRGNGQESYIVNPPFYPVLQII